MKFKLILADPPWLYRQGGRGASINHYESMTYYQLEALGPSIDKIRDPGQCVLMMWSTLPQLQQAMDLIGEWGFQYKTAAPWIKVDQAGKPMMGTGHWLRGCAEILLLGVYGMASPPADKMLGLLTAFEDKRYQHSRKPESVYQLAESMNSGPYLEMFATQQRDGWTSIGNSITGNSIEGDLECLSQS